MCLAKVASGEDNRVTSLKINLTTKKNTKMTKTVNDFEAGTPVVFIYGDRKVSGEVITHGSDKAISLYKDDNYCGDDPLIVIPDWAVVFSFADASPRKIWLNPVTKKVFYTCKMAKQVSSTIFNHTEYLSFLEQTS